MVERVPQESFVSLELAAGSSFPLVQVAHCNQSGIVREQGQQRSAPVLAAQCYCSTMVLLECCKHLLFAEDV